MKINNVSNSPNFTSVVPVRVFIDGRLSINSQNSRPVIQKIQSMLAELPKTQKIIDAKVEFAKYDRDFNCIGIKEKTGELIRNYYDSGLWYLFTGPHAKILNNLGKAIGPEKHNGLASALKTTKTYEVKKTTDAYFNKIREFLTYPLIRVKEFIDPKTRVYKGEPVVLEVFATSTSSKNKILSFDIEKIVFSKVSQLTTEKKVKQNVAKMAADGQYKINFDNLT